MKTSRVQVEKTREALLVAAAEGYRRHGFDGVKVAEVMAGAGLTHGGFYTYFTSKGDMAARACQHYFGILSARMRLRAERGEKVGAYIDSYLSLKNRDHPDQACLFSSLSGEVVRQPDEVREVYTAGLKSYIDDLTALTGDRAAAIATLSGLVGAMSLARAANDEAFSREILETAKTLLIKR